MVVPDSIENVDAMVARILSQKVPCLGRGNHGCVVLGNLTGKYCESKVDVNRSR